MEKPKKAEYSPPTLTHQGSVNEQTLGFQTTNGNDGGTISTSTYNKPSD